MATTMDVLPVEMLALEDPLAAEKAEQERKEQERREQLAQACINYLQSYKSKLETLWDQQAKALKVYMAEPYGDEVDGRSKFVESLAFDAIEWLKPFLMRVFCGGSDIVQISGVGEEDEAGAKLLNEKVNLDFQKNFNAFRLFYDWFDDALKLKIGVVKWWWESETQLKKVRYEGLTDAEYIKIKSNPRYLIESALPTPQGWDVSAKKMRRINRPMADCIPPEEFIYNPGCKSLSESDFVAHKKRMHKTEAMKRFRLSENELQDIAVTLGEEALTNERLKDLGGREFLIDKTDENYIYLYECCLADYSSGEKVPLIVTLMGNRVVEVEENSYGRPNYCAISPILLAHRETGLSYIDALADLQRLGTSLTRIILDNCYFQNNAALVYDPQSINQDDLANNNSPGGLIRTVNGRPPSQAVFPMPIQALGEQVFEMRRMVDQIKDNRIGNSQYSRGDDSQAINKTAHGIAQLMDAASKRAELVCRIFAETGVKDLAKAIAEMNIDYLDDGTAIRIDQQWQTISRRDIDVDYDLIIDVGLGTGSKDALVGQLQALFKMLVPLVQNGVISAGGLVEVVKQVAETMGIKNSQKFLLLPQPPPQPPMLNAGPAGGMPPAGGPTPPPPGPQGPGPAPMMMGGMVDG